MLSTRSPNMPEITVTINGVTKLLEKLNPYKASGPDMVSARFLKEVATEISPALTLLFNASILQRCKVLCITNKLKPIKSSYYVHNHKLDTVETGKYLGVLINKHLSWKPHVDAICKKANQMRAFLDRNLKDCQRDVKSQCYKTYVLPIVEYANVDWDSGGRNPTTTSSNRNGTTSCSSFCYWRLENNKQRISNDQHTPMANIRTTETTIQVNLPAQVLL